MLVSFKTNNMERRFAIFCISKQYSFYYIKTSKNNVFLSEIYMYMILSQTRYRYKENSSVVNCGDGYEFYWQSLTYSVSNVL